MHMSLIDALDGSLPCGSGRLFFGGPNTKDVGSEGLVHNIEINISQILAHLLHG